MTLTYEQLKAQLDDADREHTEMCRLADEAHDRLSACRRAQDSARAKAMALRKQIIELERQQSS
jgi:hypothetical protein